MYFDIPILINSCVIFMIYANKYDYVFLIACNVCIYQFILVLQPYRPLIACKWT